MAYFKNLFPELQDQKVRMPAGPGGAPPYAPEGQYPATNQELFSGQAPTQQTLDQDASRAAQIKPASAPAPQQEGPNVKAQYNKAAQQKARGWTDALKLATDVDADIEKASLDSEGIVNITPKDHGDIKGIIEKLGRKSEAPELLADDLRVVASRKSVSPVWSQKLLKAASLLDEAAKADQYIEGLRKPGGPLELTKQEAGQSAARLQSQIAPQQDALKGAGSLRMAEAAPNLQRDVAQQQRLQEFAGEHGNEPPDFNSVLTANGWDKAIFLKRALALQTTLGLDMSQRIAPGAAGMAIASMLRGMGDAGQAILQQMVKDSKRGEQAPGGGSDPNKKPGAEGDYPDPYQAQLRDLNQQYQQSFRELKQLKGFDSMWDVLFYVLFSVMLGPGPAAVLFTNKGKRGSLEWDLDMYRKEIDSVSRQQETHARMKEDARRYAANREFDERKFKYQQDKDEFYMKLRSENPAGKDPVMDNLMGGYRLWQDELDEAEKVLSNQFNFSDAQIKAANAKRNRALPMVEKSRANLMRYRAQNLQAAQGGGEANR